MTESLRKHIERFVTVPSDDLTQVLTYFQPLHFEKKENLLTEGKICQSNYFVVEGCLRLFFVNEKGTEQTTHFALENWWMADYMSFSNQTPATFCIQAVEKSSVLAITYAQQEEMLQRFPCMERYFRLMHQRAHAAGQFRVRWLYSLSHEEQYRQFVRRYPEFVQRIPQYLLASFLGFTPEYLSEIRRKKLS